MAEINVRTGEIEVRATKLTKSLLKQINPIEQFVRDYLPGGKEAQDPEYKIVGWVHGSVLESDENYWVWVLIQVTKGEFVRMRTSKDNVSRAPWMANVKQIYVV